jgi:hypothetical protein
MGEDNKDQAPGVVIRAVPAGDDAGDTEGHRVPPNVTNDDDPDGVVIRVVGDADDTEGHRVAPSVVPDDVVDAVSTDDEANGSEGYRF